MTTRWVRAGKITTADHVVTGGENNPLHQGAKRRAWKVCERVSDGRTTLRMVIRGGASGGGDAWLTGTFDPNQKLRVLDGGPR